MTAELGCSDTFSVFRTNGKDGGRNGSKRKSFPIKGKKRRSFDVKDSTATASLLNGAPAELHETGMGQGPFAAEDMLKIQAELSAVRHQFELLKRTATDELNTLPEISKGWVEQASQALVTSQAESRRLREKLARESAARIKLLHQVQDLRGTARVYCRPLGSGDGSEQKQRDIFSVPSHEIILLHRERLSDSVDGSALSFEFDRVFEPGTNQKELYAEMEDSVLGVLDGFNVCIMAYGQSGTGKTHTMLGDIVEMEGGGLGLQVDNFGIQLEGMKQLFEVANHRSERYEDTFTVTIVEIFEERLCDLVAGTEIGDSRGSVSYDGVGSSSRKNSRNRRRTVSDDEVNSQQGASTSSRTSKNKLEILTDKDGETIVQGLVSVKVTSFNDVLNLWKQALANRRSRIAEQGLDVDEYEAGTHVICSLRVSSSNVSTGTGSSGKIQFVDLAGADLISRTTSGKPKTAADGILAPVCNDNEWRFASKSIATLCDVVHCRTQFMRSVPYRNSTLTHLLRDSLESDTKVLVVACLSSNPKNIQQTASTLRFASMMRKLSVGKATKHTVHKLR